MVCGGEVSGTLYLKLVDASISTNVLQGTLSESCLSKAFPVSLHCCSLLNIGRQY